MRLGRVRAVLDENADTTYGQPQQLQFVTGGTITHPYAGTPGHEVIDAPPLVGLISEHLN